MVSVRRRAKTLLVAVAAIAAVALPATPAAAASCTVVPGSVPGTDVSILGNTHRVPTISNVTVCYDNPTAPLVAVQTSANTYCSTGCFTVLLRGGAIDPGGVTVSYRADGITKSETVNPGGTGGGSDTCVFSVGSPDAPYPTCAIAVGPDGLPDTGFVTQAVEDALEDVPDPTPIVTGVRDDVIDAIQNAPDPMPIVAGVQDDVIDAIQSLPDPMPIVADLQSTIIDTIQSLPDPLVVAGELRLLVLRTVQDLPNTIDNLLFGLPLCGTVPDAPGPDGTSVSFCGDPRGWMTAMGDAVQEFCEQSCSPNTIRCLVDPRFC